jgi:hypothetical protein
MAHAIDIVRNAQGERSPFPALFEQRKAVILDDRGDYAQAATILDHVLDTQAQINGKDSGEYAAVQLEVARRHVLLGEFDKAVLMLRDLAASSRNVTAPTIRAPRRRRPSSRRRCSTTATRTTKRAPPRKRRMRPGRQGRPRRTCCARRRRDARAMVRDARRRGKCAAAARTRGSARLARDRVGARPRRPRARDAARARRHPGRARRRTHRLRTPARQGRRAASANRSGRIATRATCRRADVIEASMRPVFERAFPEDSAFRHGCATASIEATTAEQALHGLRTA